MQVDDTKKAGTMTSEGLHMKSIVCCLLLACAAGLPAALTQERAVGDDDRSELRQYLKFGSWPGKNGAMKKGFAFKADEYSALNGWKTISDELDLHHLKYGLVRRVLLERDRYRLRVVIAVAHTLTDNGHELLLRLGDPNTTIALRFVCKRGDTDGIAIGDVNIVSSNYPFITIAFGRNNVACILRIEDGLRIDDDAMDVKSLAGQLDAKIRALPDLTAAGFEALRPAITTFEPAKPAIEQMGDDYSADSTVLKVVAADPSSEPLRNLFEDGSHVRIDSTVVPPVVKTGGEVGTFPLKVMVVNQSLQYGEAETKITVVDGFPQK